METDFAELEESKENVLPLRRGRNIATLQAALDDRARDSIVQMKQKFETNLRLYAGDDELEIWYPYILWVEQNFPKGGQDGNLSVLLKKCLNNFISKPQYKDDERYVACWLKFVRYAPSPMDVFLLMDEHEIGHKSAAFYEAWSWHLEQLGTFRKANSVLQQGIDNNAQPLKKLLDAQKQLSRKVVQQYAKDPKEEEVIESRSALGGLKSVGKKNSAPVSRVGSSKLDGPISMPLNQNQIHPSQNRRVHVLQDAENQPSVKMKAPVVSVPFDSYNSENQLKRKPWNKVKHKDTTNKLTTAPQKPDFTVHDDNQGNMGVGRKLNPAFTTVLRGSQVEAKFGFFEPEDPNKLYVCEFQKLYCGAEEFQPEEVAAAQWFQNQKKKEEEDQVSKLKEELQKLKSMTANMNNGQRISCIDENMMLNQHLTQDAPLDHKRGLDSMGSMHSGKSTPRSECSSPTRAVIALWNATLSIPAKEDYSNSAGTSPTHLQSLTKSEVKKSTITIYNDDQDNMAPRKPAFQIYSDDHENVASKKPSFPIYSDDHENAAPKKPAFQVYTDYQEDMAHKKQAFQVHTDYQEDMAHKKQAFQIYTDNEDDAAPKKPAFQVYTDDQEDIAHKKPAFQVYTDVESNYSARKQPYQDEIKSNPFQIYTDNQDNNVPSNANPDTHIREENDDYKENMAPAGLVQNLRDRASSHNILQITDRPICFGEDHADEDEDLGVHPLPDDDCDTIAPLTSQLHFAEYLKYSSTPCTFNRVSKTYEDSLQPAQISKQRTTEFKTPCNTEKLPLSPIIEASRESKSSSAYTTSSSSSACSSALTTRRFTSSAKSLLCPSTSVLSSVDPFDPELISNLLSSVDLTRRPGFMRFPVEMTRIHRQKCFTFGHHKLHIVSQLTEGGEGVIYKAETENDKEWPKEIAVKLYKPNNLWEFYICSEVTTRIGNIPGMVDIRDSLTTVLLSPVYNSCNLLITQYCPYGSLVDLVNSCSNPSDNIPESLTLYLTWEMLQIVSQLHRFQFVHGDIKPDNFMVLNLPTDASMLEFSKTHCLRLIDFGQSIDLSTFPKGTTFIGSTKTENFVCPEMHDNKPWVFQTDYFGILGTIHTLLFRDYMEIVKDNDKWGIRNKFKRYWQIQFWNKLFDTLLNIPDCDHMPDLSGFIKELEQIINRMKDNLLNAGSKHLSVLNAGKSYKK